MNHDAAMFAFLRLAAVSDEKRQLPGRDRFLLLAAIEACRAGLTTIAQRCREIVVEANPAHLIGRYDSMADALSDDDFAPFEASLKRFCTYERAEHLLAERGEAVGDSEADYAAEAAAVLDGRKW